MAEGTLVVDKKHTASPITADDILYDLPENWKWTRFADIVTFSSGKTPQRQNTAYWSNVEYPWVSIADMQADSLTTTTKEQISEAAFEDCFSGKIAPAGTMIMSFKLTIGKVSILGMDAVHNEAIISIYPTAPVGDSRILQKWLFKILPLVAATGNSKNAIKGKTLNAISMSTGRRRGERIRLFARRARRADARRPARRNGTLARAAPDPGLGTGICRMDALLPDGRHDKG